MTSLFSGNEESLKEVIEQFINQVLEQQQTKADQRLNLMNARKSQGMRNGYKERGLTTEVKTLTLRVPQIRDGIFSIDYSLSKKRKGVNCHLDGDGRKWPFDQKARQDNGGALRDTCSASTVSRALQRP